MMQRLNKVPSCIIKTSLTPRWPALSALSDRVGPALSCATFSCTGRGASSSCRNSSKGIAPTTLSERLWTLRRMALSSDALAPMSPPWAEYVLTAKGLDLGPIVRAMRESGRKTRVDLPMRRSNIALSLRCTSSLIGTS